MTAFRTMLSTPKATVTNSVWLLPLLLAALPHALHLPTWVSASCLGLWLWRGYLSIRGRGVPGKLWPTILALSALAAILLQSSAFIGRQAGVPMLALLLFIKLLETETPRQKNLLLLLCHFLAVSNFLFSQSLTLAVYLLAVALLNTVILIRLQPDPDSRLREQLALSARLFLSGVPLAILLFLLFPRLDHPLWTLPSQETAARSGLSDSMRPGDISQLILSSDVAFRVRFAAPPPDLRTLYWRGPVLDTFDGRTWRVSTHRVSMSASITALAPPVEYSLTMEAHDRHWLVTLGAPMRVPSSTRLVSGMQLVSLAPVKQRTRYAMRSAPSYRLGGSEIERLLARQLPPDSNPRSVALARQWQNSARSPTDIIEQALSRYRGQFTYTLTPPRLGQHAVDEFLFDTKRGFCEHFASSFVVLMRAAGIPARVVTGYQGGEINPLDQHLVVRQSDAHAWAEVWLDQAGWVRVDPTASVSPERIERGLAAALPALDVPPGLARLNAPWIKHIRHGWEALNNGWNQWVIGYGHSRQSELLAWVKPGAGLLKWVPIAVLLIASLFLLAWALRQGGKPSGDASLRLYNRFLRKLRKRALVPRHAEAPSAFAERAAIHYSEQASPIMEISQLYLRARYAEDHQALGQLKTAVRKFPP